MSNDIYTTRFIAEYGQVLAGEGQRAAKRVISRKQSTWVVNAEKELLAFQRMAQQWITDFKGGEHELVRFKAFLGMATVVFWESILKAMEEEAAKKVANPDFQQRLQAIKRDMREHPERYPAASRDSVPPPPAETEIPLDLRYKTVDDITAAVILADTAYPDWLATRASDINEEVLVSLTSQKTAADALKMFERCVDKFRTKLWDRVRHLRPHADQVAILAWINRSTAVVAHYATVILTGSSRGLLNEEQTKAFEKQIAILRHNYASEMHAMENLNTTSLDNASSSTTTENTDMNTAASTTAANLNGSAQPEVSLHDLAEAGHIERTVTVEGATPANDAVGDTAAATSNDNIGETPAPLSFFQRAKARAVAAYEAINFKVVGKWLLAAIALVAVVIAALFGIKHGTKSDTILNGLKAAGGLIKAFASSALSTVKGRLPKKADVPAPAEAPAFAV